MPSQNSVGPSEGVDIAVLDFRLQNKSGGDLVRGNLALVGTQVDATTSRFNSFITPGAGDLPVGIFCVLLEPIADDAWGMVRVQGRVKHMKCAGATAVGAVMAVLNSDKVTAANGTSKRKIVFKAESASGGANEFVTGLFDGWAGFGADLV